MIRFAISTIIALIVWVGIFFGYFIASQPLFLFLSLGIALGMFFVLKRFSLIQAIVFTLITLFVAGYTFVSGFEEDYCLRKGDAAGNKYVLETYEDAKIIRSILPGTSSTAGQTVSLSFLTHMRCHYDFNLWSAVKDSYSIKH